MNANFAKCSQCGRVIYASQAVENGGSCGAECPNANAVQEATVRRRREPAPVVPPPAVTLPVEPPTTDVEAPVAGDEPAVDTPDGSGAEEAPEARMVARGQNRMHGGGSR